MMSTLLGFAPKPLTSNTDSMACSAPRPSLSPFQFATDALLKRKRSDSGSFSASPVVASPQQAPGTLADNQDNPAKRRKVDELVQPRTQSPKPTVEAASAPTSKMSPTQRDSTALSSSSSALNARLPPTDDKSCKAPPPMQKSVDLVADSSCAQMTDQQDFAASAVKPVASSKPKLSAEEKRQRTRDIIQSQLNLEILLKHRELGDIESELAKCQVALEQLRRAKLIPYPGSQGISEQVSLGKGAAIQPRPGFSRPSHAAPWGVTDGPYSRHYAQWLLPDPAFDSVPQQAQQFGDLGADVRSTRGTVGSGPLTGSRIRHPSGRAQLQALNTNYSTPKERHGPLTVTRPSDGKLVKLVCKACGKENASSMQGFLNHCRIAHKDMEFKTHDEAIDQCGVPVEPGEAVAATTPVTAPAVQTHHQTFSTPGSARPFLHPLVTEPATPSASAPSYLATAGRFGNITPQSALASAGPWTADTTSKQRKSVASATLNESSLTPSQLTPKLSALFQRRGLGGDLSKMVVDAKHKIDIESLDTLVPEEENEAVVGPRKVANKPKARNSLAARASASTPSTSTAPTPAKPLSRLPAANDPQAAVNIAPQSTPLSTNVSASEPMLLDDPSDMRSSPATGGSNGQSTFIESPTDTNALSPRTVDTNPGMMTDHGEDVEFDSRSEFDESFTLAPGDHDMIKIVNDGEKDEKMRNMMLECPGVKQSPFHILQNPQSTTGSDPIKKRKRGRPSKKDKELELGL